MAPCGQKWGDRDLVQSRLPGIETNRLGLRAGRWFAVTYRQPESNRFHLVANCFTFSHARPAERHVGSEPVDTRAIEHAGQRRATGTAEYLLPSEAVLVDARPAWSAWTGTLLLAVLVCLGSLITAEPLVITVGVVAALLLVGYVWYQRRQVRYIVTDARVVVVTGITSRKTNEAWLEDVKGMQTGASFLERRLGHGHILVSREIRPRGSFLVAQLRGRGMKLGGIGNHEEID